MDRLKPSLVRQIFVLLLILFLTVLIVTEVMPYLSGILGAVTLYVILKGWMKKLLNRGWRPPLAAALLMAGSFVGILIPVTLIAIMLTSKIGKAVANSERVLSALKLQLNNIEEHLGYSISSNIDTASITNWVSSNLQNLLVGLSMLL